MVLFHVYSRRQTTESFPFISSAKSKVFLTRLLHHVRQFSTTSRSNGFDFDLQADMHGHIKWRNCTVQLFLMNCKVMYQLCQSKKKEKILSRPQNLIITRALCVGYDYLYIILLVTHPCKCQCMKNVLFANKFMILFQAFPSSLPVWD